MIPPRAFFPLIPLAAAMPLAHALEIRAYDPLRHDRFTGFPEAPAWNERAWYGSRNYAALGWSAHDPRLQLAMVTPRHFVFAGHNRPPDGTAVRFLRSDGSVVERTINGTTGVRNESGQFTDLALGTLAEPADAGFFPVLNLPADAAFPGTELVIFGWHARGGRGVFESFQLTSISGLGDTRLFRILFNKSQGHGDDGHAVSGDSGSPSFALAGGKPALVGLHAAASETNGFRTTFDTFVPAYVPQLDALLESDGYRITPAYPAPVELTLAPVTHPALLRQGLPGTLDLEISNASAVDATNLQATITFPEGAEPDTVETPGWIIGSEANGVFQLRRGGLAGGAAVSFSARWSAVPAIDSLPVAASFSSDGSPVRNVLLDPAPAPTYAVWATALDDPSPDADPDGDGVVNLIEYALGGDPASAASRHVIPLSSSVSQGVFQMVFPIRSDAPLRGLTYLIEHAPSPAGPWTTEPPPGFLVEHADLEHGFRLRSVSWPAPGGTAFARLRVKLDALSAVR